MPISGIESTLTIIFVVVEGSRVDCSVFAFARPPARIAMTMGLTSQLPQSVGCPNCLNDCNGGWGCCTI